MLATDISPAILDYAADAARTAGLTNVEVREMDGEALDDLDDGAFDAVISRVGLIYFPDQERALREIHRVLTNWQPPATDKLGFVQCRSPSTSSRLRNFSKPSNGRGRRPWRKESTTGMRSRRSAHLRSRRCRAGSMPVSRLASQSS